MRFATYGRKSVYSDKSDSVDNQERMCREYVELRFQGKIDSFESYSDEGMTGANTNRPGLKRLLADVEDGLVDALIVYQLGGLLTGSVSFGFWTAVALAALAAVIFLLARKGYRGEEPLQRLSSVAAASR